MTVDSSNQHRPATPGPGEEATDPLGRAAGLPPLTGLNFVDFAAMLLVLFTLGAVMVTGAVLALRGLWVLTGELWISPNGLWWFSPVVLALAWILLRWEKIR